jgi:Tfp pilus assembly protein PilO
MVFMWAGGSETTTDALDPETRRFGRMLHCAGCVLVLLCGAIGYTLIYEGAESSIAKLATSIQELRLSVQNAPAIRKTHEELTQRLEDLKVGMASLQQHVPRAADAGKFLKDITIIADEEALQISNFQPDKPIGKEGFTEMDVTLTGQGDYKSICVFLDRLSKLSRLSKVKNLNISTSGTEAKLPMSATLVIYFGLGEADKAKPEEVQRG